VSSPPGSADPFRVALPEVTNVAAEVEVVGAEANAVAATPQPSTKHAASTVERQWRVTDERKNPVAPG
jgi:hypothetical protein